MMHTTQAKTNSPKPAVKTAESTQKSAHNAGSSARLPAWTRSIGDHPPTSLQTKLAISQPGDIYEQEADRVADQVMRVPDSAAPIVQSKCACGGTPGPAGECTECAPKRIALQCRSASQGEPSSVPPIVHEVAGRGRGRPLEGSTRALMESRFGYDFSNVRVHTNARAEESAQAVNALAYTVGKDVVFGSGQYKPGTREGKRLLAHELTHVVQQGGRDTPVSSVSKELTNSVSKSEASQLVQGAIDVPRVQRFVGTEHEELGNVTGVQQIDLGNNVVLSWGQIVALAGDYYGTVEELLEDTRTPDGRARIRAALEHYGSPGVGATHLPAPTAQRRTEVLSRYARLALENIPHFVEGGTAWASWQGYHARAVDAAIRAGLANDDAARAQAYVLEAFGEHFLTDAFSASHIRTPRSEIIEWYVNTFAPKVIDHFIDNLRERLVEAIYAQLPWYVGFAPGYARGRIRTALNRRLQEAIAAVGGREQLIKWFGLLVGGAVSGGIHDIEGSRGLMVSSLEHPQPWRAFGDTGLSRSPETRTEAEQAILAAKQDIDDAFFIGQLEAARRNMAPEPAALPTEIFFGFNRDDLTVEGILALFDAVSYLTYHPEARLALVGHTDQIGREGYNLELGKRRAQTVARFLIQEGIDASRLTTSSAGETQPVTRNRREFWRNRRVSLIWSEQDTGASHDIAYERAISTTLAQIGPPYRAMRFLPTAVPGQNPPLPDWHWGNIPRELRTSTSQYVAGNVRPLVADVVNNPALDPQEIEGYHIEPRPIVQAIVNELLQDPTAFLERAFGESAGPQ